MKARHNDPEDAQMMAQREQSLEHSRMPLLVAAILALISCTSDTPTVNQTELNDFATRYAAAWSSKNPAALATFYAQDGSLSVNDGEPAVGHAAITIKVQGFMQAFPDMVVKLDHVSGGGSSPTFHWIWTGTNSGPGGTGKHVHITGREEWTLGADGLIVKSKGYYDEAEYRRQMQAGAPPAQQAHRTA